MSINVKICFLLDCTASMESWIRAAKNQIRDIINKTQHENPTAIMKVAFVGYRDYGDDTRIILIPFTPSVSIVLNRIHHVHAEGGDDVAEDVASALDEVLHLDWDHADVRCLFHIADAPAHGLKYHAPYTSDRYPMGDPQSRDPAIMMTQLSMRGIDYTFVKIDSITDSMIVEFANAYSGPGSFRVLDLQRVQERIHMYGNADEETQVMTPHFVRTVTHSIRAITAGSQDPASL